MLSKCLIKFEPSILKRVHINVEELTKDIDELHIAYLAKGVDITYIYGLIKENKHLIKYQKTGTLTTQFLGVITNNRQDFSIVMEKPIE